jgi:hypothetical protein
MPTPEPPTTVRPAVSPETNPADEESPAAPAIPSFASLRAPRGRSAVDLLLPGVAAGAAAPRQAPAPRHAPAPRSAPEPEPAPAPRRAPAPRPAEYADLLRFGVHLVRAAVAVPGRVAGWAVREPQACLRRVLGDRVH